MIIRGIFWGIIIMILTATTILSVIGYLTTHNGWYLAGTLSGASAGACLFGFFDDTDEQEAPVPTRDDTEISRLLQEFRESPYRHGFVEGRWTE
jgi:hypothetical protein